jgi:hypothetical protein
MIDTLVHDIEVIKMSAWCEVEPPTASQISPSNSSSATHTENNEGAQISHDHGFSSPDLSEELILKTLCGIEDLDNKDDQDESADSDAYHPSSKRPALQLQNHRNRDTYRRKKRRYRLDSSSSAESLGLSTVHINPAFSDSKSSWNPYLASTSKPQISSSSITNSPEAWKDSISRTYSSELGPDFRSSSHDSCPPTDSKHRPERVSSFSLSAKGLIKQDTDQCFYTPHSVVLAPLVQLPKAKKHHLLRLLEPDIGQTLKTFCPNQDSPSTAIPSTEVYHLPSLLLTLSELEKREKLILLSLQAHHYTPVTDD